jgi:uncharacterized membrane protein
MGNNSPEPVNLDLEPERMYAALCYLWVLVFIPYIAAKQDDFVLFHIKQGMVLLAGFILAVGAAYWIPWVGNLLFVLLMLVDLMGLVQALHGRRWQIPVIGSMIQRFRF